VREFAVFTVGLKGSPSKLIVLELEIIFADLLFLVVLL